jgi:hypothetical protein
MSFIKKSTYMLNIGTKCQNLTRVNDLKPGNIQVTSNMFSMLVPSPVWRVVMVTDCCILPSFSSWLSPLLSDFALISPPRICLCFLIAADEECRQLAHLGGVFCQA